MSTVRVLDICCGNRAVWFDRHHRSCTYVDIRPEVTPDIVASATALPPQVGSGFDLVLFDPPHKNNGAAGGMTRAYGHWTAEQITMLIIGVGREAHRVTKPAGLMAFKWNDHSRKLETALELLEPYWLPLFGHGVRPQQRGKSNTSWVMLHKW